MQRFYDHIRILGLILSVQLIRMLITLSYEPENLELKKFVVRYLIFLCYNSMLLKPKDRHF